MTTPITNAIWAITDGSAGMHGQAVGLGHAIGLPVEEKICRRSQWVGWLPNIIAPGALRYLSKDSAPLTPPWPKIAISCGRRSAPLGAAIKRASGGKTLAVHIQDPQMPLSAFDLVVAMQHDKIAAPNVIKTDAALHKLTHDGIEEAGKIWAPQLAHLPRPWVAVMIGGSTNKYQFHAEAMQQLLEQLKNIHTIAGGSLLISTSRRTGEGNIQQLQEMVASLEYSSNLHWYTGEGENPYLGYLALADHLMVTNDSVSMLSEAAFTGKPIYVLPLQGHVNTKPATFAERQINNNIARKWNGKLRAYAYTPLDETTRIATYIRQHYANV